MKIRAISLILAAAMLMPMLLVVPTADAYSWVHPYVAVVDRIMGLYQYNKYDGKGMLCDLDGNGVDELITLYYDSAYTEQLLSVHTTSGGTLVPLIEDKSICSNDWEAGGAFYVLDINGERRVASTCSTSHSGHGKWLDYIEWTIYSVNGTQLQTESTMTVQHTMLSPQWETIEDESYCIIDGQRYPYSVYEEWADNMTILGMANLFEPASTDGVMTLYNLHKELKKLPPFGNIEHTPPVKQKRLKKFIERDPQNQIYERELHYDEVTGLLVKITDSSDSAYDIDYTYDAQGRVIKAEADDYNVVNSSYRYVEYVYDGDRLICKVLPSMDGGVTQYRYSYDAAGRLAEEFCDDPWGKTQTTYTYDDQGRIATKTYTNWWGTNANDKETEVTTYQYDPQNRVTNERSLGAGGSVYETYYEYDNQSRVKRCTAFSNGDKSLQTDYRYLPYFEFQTHSNEQYIRTELTYCPEYEIGLNPLNIWANYVVSYELDADGYLSSVVAEIDRQSGQYVTEFVWEEVPGEPETLEQWSNDPEKHNIIVVDADGEGPGLTPVVGANVYVGSEYYVTDENGRVAVDNFGTQDVLITADNYREMRTIYLFRKGSGCMFSLQKKRNDNLPYFVQMTASDAPGVSVDLRYDSLHFTKDDGRQLIIRFAGNWQKHGEGSFTLYQPATEKSKGKTITVAAGADLILYPGTQLNPNVPVWAVMVSADGTRSEPVKLNLYIHPKPDYDGKADNSLDVGEGSLRLIENQDLQTDNQLINDILALNASLKTELIPFTVTEELNNDGTHTVKVLIGAFSGEGVKHFHGKKIENLTEEGFKKKNYWQEFVDLFDDKKSEKKLNEYFDELIDDLNTANAELMSTKFQHFAELDMDVAGYFTYVLDSEGRMIGDPSGGIMGIIDGKVVFGRTFITPTPIPFPYFFETEIGGNLELSCDLQLTQDGKLQPVFSVPVEAVLPQASLQGGLGARNIATAGVGGGFEHHILLNKTAKGGYCTANAFFNLKLLKIVDWKVNFANSGPFLKWGVHQTQGYRNLSDSVEAHYVSAGELTLTGRNYLANSSGWNGAAENTRNTEPLNVLQYGVMPDGTPQIHQLGDQQIALFVRDVASRSVGNHTQLVYTVRRNGVWSEPKAVWDHETADLCFDSAVVNGKLYVAWQKSSAEMTGEDPEALLDSVASASEICVAVWDPAENAFTGQRFVTDDKAMDMLPSIYASGNNVVVAWAKSGESKVFDTNSACSIHRIVCINGTWGEAETLQTTGGFIWELAAGSTAAGESILYIAGDASGRQALYCLQDEKVATLASEYNVGGLDFHNGFFAWHTDSGMYMYSGAECKAVKLPDDYPIPVTAKYVENQQQRALVWVEGGETNKIVAGIYSDGTFQKPITLVDGITEDITFMDVLLTDDNVFSLIVTTAIHNGDGYESTALCVARASLKTDARLEYADVDQADWETGKQLLRFRVINEGAYPITELTITATSGVNTLLEKAVKAELQSGESSVYTEYLDISRVKGNTDITVSIHAAHDDNSSNDTASVSIGYTDVRLELDAYEYEDTVTFVLTARNVSAVPADVSIRVTGDRADGAVLHEKNIGTVTRDNTVQYVYTVKKAEIDFGGRSQKPYFFTAVVSGNDWSEVDDSCLFCITSPVTQQENPDGEMEEIEVILPEGISVSPENLVIDGLDGEPVQLIAAITPTGAVDAEVQWEVADADVVRVDSKGRVTPLQAGTTTITARISDAIQTTVTVTVKEHVHTLERVPTRGSSCTVQGNMLYYVCSDCGKWFLDSSAQFIIEDRESVRLPLADHSYGREWSADAANHWHVCSCGEKSALEAHVPGAEPTETAPQLCTVCGWELKPANVHTHNPQKVEAKEATHTENGNKEYYICSCGNWYEDAEGTKLIKNHASVLLLKFELGDVDHNHKLTSMDAMLLMQYKAGLLEETVSFCTECANVDGKMGVNSIDAMLILQYRAGLITSFR